MKIPACSTTAHETLFVTVKAMHALILDDNADDRNALAECLDNAGYTSVATSTMSEARYALDTHHFDLFLLEAKLPDGDGFRFCHELRQHFGDGMVIIFVSAFATPLNRVVGIQVGADDFMSKPCSYDELLARIDARRRWR